MAGSRWPAAGDVETEGTSERGAGTGEAELGSRRGSAGLPRHARPPASGHGHRRGRGQRRF